MCFFLFQQLHPAVLHSGASLLTTLDESRPRRFLLGSTPSMELSGLRSIVSCTRLARATVVVTYGLCCVGPTPALRPALSVRPSNRLTRVHVPCGRRFCCVATASVVFDLKDGALGDVWFQGEWAVMRCDRESGKRVFFFFTWAWSSRSCHGRSPTTHFSTDGTISKHSCALEVEVTLNTETNFTGRILRKSNSPGTGW